MQTTVLGFRVLKRSAQCVNLPLGNLSSIEACMQSSEPLEVLSLILLCDCIQSAFPLPGFGSGLDPHGPPFVQVQHRLFPTLRTEASILFVYTQCHIRST